jgi:hypothetical protein
MGEVVSFLSALHLLALSCLFGFFLNNALHHRSIIYAHRSLSSRRCVLALIARFAYNTIGARVQCYTCVVRSVICVQ